MWVEEHFSVRLVALDVSVIHSRFRSGLLIPVVNSNCPACVSAKREVEEYKSKEYIGLV